VDVQPTDAVIHGQANANFVTDSESRLPNPA
jgi:hypothetical protein